MSGLDQAQAALERGRPVVLVTPPAVEQAGALWDLVGARHHPGVSREEGGRPTTVIVCADAGAAVAWLVAAPADRAVHAVRGLARTIALLKAGRIAVLAGTPHDVGALVGRSALQLDAVETVVLAWPESFASEHSGVLDTLLGELPGARRIVLSWNPAALADLLERHARRAEVVGAAVLSPVGPARYAIVPPARRAAAIHDALDVLNAQHPFVWRGGPVAAPEGDCDAVIAAALPSRDELVELSQRGEPLVFVTGVQLPYLRAIAAPLASLSLPSARDGAVDRGEALRARVAALVEAGDLDAELALLDPLLERFDPAEVAAGLLALRRDALKDSTRDASPPPSAAGTLGRVKVFVNVGKKDRAGAKDLVGALIREVGLDKSQIGRIDVRDTFSLVEIAGDAAERAIRGLTGTTIRGRRVAARLERA